MSEALSKKSIRIIHKKLSFNVINRSANDLTDEEWEELCKIFSEEINKSTYSARRFLRSIGIMIDTKGKIIPNNK